MRLKLSVTDTIEAEVMEARTPKRCRGCLYPIQQGTYYTSIWYKPLAEVLEASKQGDKEAKEQVRLSEIRRHAYHIDCYRRGYGIDSGTINHLIQSFETKIESMDKGEIKRAARILASLKEIKDKMLNDQLPKQTTIEVSKAILILEVEKYS